MEKTNHYNCDPNPRIVSYLKKNLVYCFDTGMRSMLKDSINNFEQRFFSNESRTLRKEIKEKKEAKLRTTQEQSTAAAEPIQEIIKEPTATQE